MTQCSTQMCAPSTVALCTLVKVIHLRPRQDPTTETRNDSFPTPADSAQHPINATFNDAGTKLKLFTHLASAEEAASDAFGFQD